MISNRWKILAAALPIMSAVFGTLAIAQPQPGGLGGFFQAVYGGSRVSIFPDDVADMAGWWDASDASTISLVAGTNRVSEWRDKSGLDRHFTQTDANERPYYDVVQNGLDAMRTASAEGMNYNTLDQTVWRFLHEGKASVFIAFEIIGPQSTADFGIILDTAGLTSTGYLLFYDNRSSIGRTNFVYVNGGTVATPNYFYTNSNYFTQDQPLIIAQVSDAANATAAERLFLYDENDTRTNTDNTGSGSVTGNTFRDLSFGQEASGGLYDLDIKIFELIIYSNTVTETERTGLIDYLATKWGI